MRYLILFLFTTTAFAGPFAEVSLSARQQLGRLPDQYWNINGQKVEIQTWRMYDINETKNPYASVMVGYQWNGLGHTWVKSNDKWEQITYHLHLSIAVRHESSIATGKDRGINDLRLTLRWE